MLLRSSITIATILFWFNTGNVFAEARIDVDYNADTDIVDLIASGVSLDTALNRLAEKLDFELVLKGDEVQRKVHLKMQGRTRAVLSKLIKPNNVIIIQNGLTPNRVTRVILLPVGEQSREQKIRASMDPPLLTDNEEDNAYRIADYERRVQRKLMGLGRRKFD